MRPPRIDQGTDRCSNLEEPGMANQYEEMLRRIGTGLRTLYRTDRKPLNWKIIDQLERLAEADEERRTGNEREKRTPRGDRSR